MTAQDDFASQKPEFSRIVHVSELGDTALTKDITATAPERAALTKRFHLNLDALDRLEAHVSLSLLPTGDVRMTAAFTAHLLQTCTVTLAPIKTEVSTDFTIIYSKDAGEDCDRDEDADEPHDPRAEPPEPLINEKIDIGEAVAEQFSLEINPFPRVKGTVFDGFTTERKGEAEVLPEKKNPFAVLSQFKTKQKNNE